MTFTTLRSFIVVRVRFRQIEFDKLSNRVIGRAIEVHRVLGPGLLESTYEQCLAHDLELNEIAFRQQWPLPAECKEVRLDCGYRIDLLVEDALIVEEKSVVQINGIYETRLLTDVKLTGVKTGLLINFNIRRLRDGTRRFVV